MSAPAPRAPLGFGGAVGLGVAGAFLLGVAVIGHAVLGQLEGAARVVIVFAEIALCVILGAVVVGVVVGLVFGVQHARLHLAGRRAEITARPVMRAEVITDDDAPAPISQGERRAIQGKQPEKFPSGNVVRLPVGERREDDTTWR